VQPLGRHIANWDIIHERIENRSLPCNSKKAFTANGTDKHKTQLQISYNRAYVGKELEGK